MIDNDSVTLRAVLMLLRELLDVIVIDGPPALEAPHRQAAARLGLRSASRDTPLDGRPLASRQKPT